MKDPALDPDTPSKSSASPPSHTSPPSAPGPNQASTSAVSSSPTSSRPGKRAASPLDNPKNKVSNSPSMSTSAATSQADKNKPRTLNRVPRACNACRKQKMRCEGADNPPCKRCRHAGYECLFEKPVRDVTTSEQGMERIRNLETAVTNINSTLTELVTTLRGGHFGPAAPPAAAIAAAPPSSSSSAPPPPHAHAHPGGHYQTMSMVPGSPQTAADSPDSSSNPGVGPGGGGGGGARSNTASAPTPSPSMGPAHHAGTGANTGANTGNGMSPLAIDVGDAGSGSGRASFDGPPSAGPGGNAQWGAGGYGPHPPQSRSQTFHDVHVSGAPPPGAAYRHPPGSGIPPSQQHPSSAEREYAHHGPPPSHHPHAHPHAHPHQHQQHHGHGGQPMVHPNGVPYSPAEETPPPVGPPGGPYRQNSGSNGGAYPPPYNAHHQQQLAAQQQQQQQHPMGPPNQGQGQGQGTNLPPIASLGGNVQPYVRGAPGYPPQGQQSQSQSPYGGPQQQVVSPSGHGGAPTRQYAGSSSGYSSSSSQAPAYAQQYAQQQQQLQAQQQAQHGGHYGSTHQHHPHHQQQQAQQAFQHGVGYAPNNPIGAPPGSGSGHALQPLYDPQGARRNNVPPTSPSSYASASRLPLPSSSSSHGQGHGLAPINPARRALPSSNITSADSSDDDDGELPREGLIAPFSVLRDMADWTDARQGVVEANGGDGDSVPPTRSPSPDSAGGPRASSSGALVASGRYRHANGGTGAGSKRESRDQGGRRPKRRKVLAPHPGVVSSTPHGHIYPDVVTVGIISEEEARDLFTIFYHGCSTFLPVFDEKVDTYETLRRRSPFCVNAICMVAAKVRDGGGPESDTYKRIYEEVQKIMCATLFSPVTRQEAVQATIIIAGWSTDGGWLSLGHAVRMAFEISMQKTWPKLLKRIKSGKTSDDDEERMLVISTRTWFCLYIFEHQLALGTGRPLILHEDESVSECELFLKHPLAIPDDLRLVSMVQLGIIKERVHKSLANTSLDISPTPPDVYTILSNTSREFDAWTARWDAEFVKRGDEYTDGEFQRQSLEVQRMFAELFHNATALRGIRGHEDVTEMPEEQRFLALRSIEIAKKGLETCLRSPNYRNGLKYAVHFTHVSATFAGSFLIRLARLFPDDVDLRKVMLDVEELIRALSSIPATRYARTLNLMLTRARQRNVLPARSNPNGPADGADDATPHQNAEQPMPMQVGGLPVSDLQHQQQQPDAMNTDQPMHQNGHQMPISGVPPPYSVLQSPSSSLVPPSELAVAPHPGDLGAQAYDNTWFTEAMLSDLALSQYGLEPFYIPPWDNDSQRNIPQIW